MNTSKIKLNPYKEVYIVKKSQPVDVEINGNKIAIDFSTNESVFDTEEKAKEYIESRNAANDPDDDGYTFEIEPWNVY